MTSNARELAQIPSTPSGRRNLIINGAMQVAQRGTSSTFSNGNAGHKVADRWIIAEAGTDSFVFDITQSTDAPDDFAYSYKVDCTTADASLGTGTQASLEQKIEAQDLQHLNYGTSSAKSLTLSFHVKSSKTGTYIVWFFQDDDSRSISAAYTINSANTWEKKTITIAGDTTGVIDNNNESGLRVRFVLFAGTDYTSGTLQTSWAATSGNDANRYVGQVNLADNTSNEWYVTGVQLEVGPVGTEFEHRSFGEELELCRRYFQDYTAGDRAAYRNIGSGTYATSTSIRVQLVFTPVMRATPSMTASGNFENFGPSGANLSSIVLTRANPSGGCFQATSSGSESQGFGTSVRTDNDTTATLFLDAEL